VRIERTSSLSSSCDSKLRVRQASTPLKHGRSVRWTLHATSLGVPKSSFGENKDNMMMACIQYRCVISLKRSWCHCMQALVIGPARTLFHKARMHAEFDTLVDVLSSSCYFDDEFDWDIIMLSSWDSRVRHPPTCSSSWMHEP